MNNKISTAEQTTQFIETFEHGWRNQESDTLLTLLHPNIELRQPFFPTCRGRDKSAQWLERVKGSVSDLDVKVQSWAQAGSSLFVEFELFSEVAKLRMPMVDRFDLRGEVAFRRLTYMDLTTIIGNSVRHPRHWWIMHQAGGTLRGTLGGTGGPLPKPITAANDHVEFVEVQGAGILPPAWRRVVWCCPRYDNAPARLYAASPFAAAWHVAKPNASKKELSALP